MDFVKALWAKVSRKAVYSVVALILAALAVRWPNLPLPNADFVTDLVTALLVCHTVTDVVAIAKTAIVEWAQGRAGPTAPAV